MNFTGITIAMMTFLTIGIWHPIVIKTEYHWGTRPWIIYVFIVLSDGMPSKGSTNKDRKLLHLGRCCVLGVLGGYFSSKSASFFS